MEPKRRIVMFNRITPEGFFATADGQLDWVVPEPKIDKDAAKRLDAGGTVLFGRKTYEMFASFWPLVLRDPERAPSPHGGPATKEMRAMAKWLEDSEKLVF